MSTPPALAGYGRDLKAVALEDAAQSLRMVDEANAGGDADALEAHVAREMTNLFDPRPFAITL